MAIDPTYEEFIAMENQFGQEHPQNEPKCPRCGKKLIREQNGSSWIIHCEDENCLSETCRGI